MKPKTEIKAGDFRVVGRDVYVKGRTKARIERVAKYLGITPSQALKRAIHVGVAHRWRELRAANRVMRQIAAKVRSIDKLQRDYARLRGKSSRN